MARIFKSTKGKDKLGYDGFTYVQGNQNLTSRNWRCDRHRQDKCKGSAATVINYSEGCDVRQLQSHNHVPDIARQQVQTALSEMVEVAGQGVQPPRRVISETLMGLSQEARAVVPKRKALVQKIQRKRTKIAGGNEPLPTTRNFELPDRFQRLMIGDIEYRFLQYDDFEGEEEHELPEDRILIFSIEPCLDALRRSPNWMIDGTFKTCPSLFYQLLVIHAIQGDFVFHCVFCLLPGKEERLYRRMFDILNQIQPGLSPTTCIADFEVGLQNALVAAYPNIQIQGCFFHFGQSIWRRVQQVGLSRDYISNEEVRLLVKSLVSLAFLPEEEIEEGFDILDGLRENNEHLRENEKLVELMSYFEDTYIGRPQRRGRRRAPRYHPSLWNVRGRTTAGLPRTNNSLEGWHCALQTLFDGPHPSIWKFFEGLKKEIVLTMVDIETMQTGGHHPPQKKKYVDINKRLQTLILRHSRNELTTLEFLKGVSYNVTLNV